MYLCIYLSIENTAVDALYCGLSECHDTSDLCRYGGEHPIKAPHIILARGLLRPKGVRCGSVVRAYADGAMGHWIDPSWGEPIELFLVPASAPRLV